MRFFSTLSLRRTRKTKSVILLNQNFSITPIRNWSWTYPRIFKSFLFLETFPKSCIMLNFTNLTYLSRRCLHELKASGFDIFFMRAVRGVLFPSFYFNLWGYGFFIEKEEFCKLDNLSVFRTLLQRYFPFIPNRFDRLSFYFNVTSGVFSKSFYKIFNARALNFEENQQRNLAYYRCFILKRFAIFQLLQLGISLPILALCRPLLNFLEKVFFALDQVHSIVRLDCVHVLIKKPFVSAFILPVQKNPIRL